MLREIQCLRVAPLVMLGLCAAWLVGPPAAPGKAALPFRIVPGPVPRKGEAPAPGGAGRLTLLGLTIVAEYLEPRARADFIRAVHPGAGDPFAAAPDRPDLYNAFRVTFDNQSSKDVTFHPGNVILMTDRNDEVSAIDLTDLYRTASGMEVADPQAAIDAARPFIFDSSTTIPRGRRLTRLLVFGPLPDRWKGLLLHFSFIEIGSEAHTLSLPFHRQILAG